MSGAVFAVVISMILSGKGPIRRGERTICIANYTIQTSIGGHAAVVQFEPKPPAGDGDVIHLTLEDGRVLSCHMLDDSPYCAVIGDGPIPERRARVREEPRIE